MNWKRDFEEASQRVIDYINEELARPRDAGQDLGIEIPHSQTLPTPPLEIEMMTESMNEETERARKVARLRKHQPNPPYRCICGLKFDTAEERIAHRHPMDSQGKPLRYNFEQWEAMRRHWENKRAAGPEASQMARP